MLTWLAIDGAKSAAIDPSEADLTGRTLEFLGNFAGLNTQHEFIKRGTKWLIQHQEKDGSWYGRWGVCYIYGTWASLTGLQAVGLPINHDTLQKGVKWLLSIQNSTAVGGVLSQRPASTICSFRRKHTFTNRLGTWCDYRRSARTNSCGGKRNSKTNHVYSWRGLENFLSHWCWSSR